MTHTVYCLWLSSLPDNEKWNKWFVWTGVNPPSLITVIKIKKNTHFIISAACWKGDWRLHHWRRWLVYCSSRFFLYVNFQYKLRHNQYCFRLFSLYRENSTISDEWYCAICVLYEGRSLSSRTFVKIFHNK